MRRSAILSACRFYRYALERAWDARLPVLVVCMLNPSTGDDLIDDPTIKELIRFARLWGFGALHIVNLNAWRASRPADMKEAREPFGPENGQHIEAAFALAKANGSRMLVAWGNGGDFDDRAEWFANRAIGQHQLTLLCLGRTQHGHPKHPMARGRHRIPRDQQPITWRASA